MLDRVGKIIKATIIDIIVALLITMVIFLAVDMFFGQEINLVFGIANTISINTDEKQEKSDTKLNSEKKQIENYPEYGTQYGTIEIPKIRVNLPLYFGDTLEVLKKGVGHSSGSYFPGEGGSIICMGHNSKNVFRKFYELQVGDKITIKITYGEFNYQIYDMQIIEEHEKDKLPIQQEEEKLMVYTCYPFNNIGYATHRYVVYANLIE